MGGVFPDESVCVCGNRILKLPPQYTSDCGVWRMNAGIESVLNSRGRKAMSSLAIYRVGPPGPRGGASDLPRPGWTHS